MATQKGTTTSAPTTDAKAAPANSKVDLGLLEEDDEFEEFPADDWPKQAGDDDEEVTVWEDNWDDDNIEDDFSVQLKAELQKQGFIDKDGTPIQK